MISCFISRVSALTNGHLFDKIDSVLTGVPLKFLGHKYLRLKKKNHETDVHILLMAFWCRSSIPFLPAANEDTLCVFRLHVSCTFASIGNMRWFPLPLNQKHNVRDRDYLESNGSKQCETGGMFTNKH